jgi:peptidoglycan/LPS O-acetylase OafA/YrhL
VSFHWSGRGGFYPILKDQYDIAWWPSFLNPISKCGYLGVDVFFVLSGAVIARSALNSNPKRFAESRFLRLFPVYFLSTIIAIVITPIAAVGFNRSQDLFGVTGLQFWVGGPTIVGTSWTLPYEIGFYFLIYLAIIYNSRKKLLFGPNELFNFLATWLLLSILASDLNFKPITFLTIQGFGPYFILGACLSQMNDFKNSKKFAIMFAISLTLSGKELISRVPHVHHALIFSALLLFVIVIIILTSNFVDLSKYLSPINAPVATLSLMTYPIYLLHETVGMSVISELNKNGVSIKISYLTVFLSVTGVSWISVKFYEPFCINIYKRFFSRQT